MNTTALPSPADLSDQELLARTLQLAAEERQATAQLIAHLAEVDARRLYLSEGYSSLFAYCTEALRLSEHAAYGRIEAARAARRFPLILEMLADGSVTLTTVGLLAAHLTAENHQDLLERARGKSRRAVEEMVAELAPQHAVPAVIRRLPARPSPTLSAPRDKALSCPAAPGPAPAPVDGQDPAASEPSPAAAATPAPARPATVSALAPDRYKIQFTALAETCAKLRMAQDLLRHQIPDGNLDEVVNRALTVLLEQLARQKFAASDRPRRGRPTAPGSRHIPAEVKRAVWLRDGGRCTFAGVSGRRCSATGFLEFHHLQPHAAGGEPTVENIQLRCRAHNVFEAELFFGASVARVREAPAAYSVRTEFVGRGNWGCQRTGYEVGATDQSQGNYPGRGDSPPDPYGRRIRPRAPAASMTTATVTGALNA